MFGKIDLRSTLWFAHKSELLDADSDGYWYRTPNGKFEFWCNNPKMDSFDNGIMLKGGPWVYKNGHWFVGGPAKKKVIAAYDEFKRAIEQSWIDGKRSLENKVLED